MANKKPYQPPQAKAVKLQEDSTSADCQGKRVGCYAGSSCGSIRKEEPKK